MKEGEGPWFGKYFNRGERGIRLYIGVGNWWGFDLCCTLQPEPPIVQRNYVQQQSSL
jgi:hypothetical protein